MPRDLFYENLIRPILFGQDPEAVHHFVSRVLNHSGLALSFCPYRYTKNDLQIDLFSQKLANPIGLAAGFDKNGKLISVLKNLGFGFAEIGSVCAQPHGGNDQPRLFRLPKDEAVINRLGLNGLGAETVVKQLKSAQNPLPYAINIAKTNKQAIAGDAAVEDVLYTFSRIKDLPALYAVVNVSCPNTKEGCINESGFVKTILQEIEKINLQRLPILLKLSPDSSDEFLDDLMAVAEDNLVQGFVCGNTTVSRDTLTASPDFIKSLGAGGLSGKPLKAYNLSLTRKINRLKTSSQIIIGVGGISSGQDAYDYICAGASLVEIYTGLVYNGPSLVKQICQELSLLLKRDSMTLRQAIGSGR